MLKKIKMTIGIVAIFAGIGMVLHAEKKVSANSLTQPASAQERYLAEVESADNYEFQGNVNVDVQPVEPTSAVNPTPAVDTTAVTVQPAQSSNVSSLPWYVVRSAGIVGYGMMFLIILLGEGMTTGWAYIFMKPTAAWVTHKYLGIAFGVTLLVHMISLLFDKFVYFNLAGILVPFASNYNPLFVSFGILGFYLVVIVLASSLLIRTKSPLLWRYVHYLVYPLFILSFVHGVFLGTDTQYLVMQLLYSLTGTIFVLLLLQRWRFNSSRI